MPFGASIHEAFSNPMEGFEDSSTADLRNLNNLGGASLGTNISADLPSSAQNFRTDTYDVNTTDFLDVAKISTPDTINQNVTPPITPILVDNLGTEIPINNTTCSGKQCNDLVQYLLQCPECRKKLLQLLGLNNHSTPGQFVLFGYDLAKLDWQKVLFYILIGIVIIAFYEIFNMLFRGNRMY